MPSDHNCARTHVYITIHVLIGPEQASSRKFGKALKGTEFQARIGLVAIDGCQLVLQWERFRPAFTMLGQRRTILRGNIV